MNRPFRRFPFLSLLFSLALSLSTTETDLQLFIFRHGDRTPLVPSSRAFNATKVGFPGDFVAGELTEKGCERLRKYGEKWSLGHSEKGPFHRSRIRAISTARSRCILSAQCFAQGLIGAPLGFHSQLPVEYLPSSVDRVFRPQYVCLDGVDVYSQSRRKHRGGVEKVTAEVYDSLGLNVSTAEVSDIIDWNVIFSLSEGKEVVDKGLIDHLEKDIFDTYTEPQMVELMTRGLRRVIWDLLQHRRPVYHGEVSGPKGGRDVAIISVHDRNLISYLKALGIVDKETHMPPYGALLDIHISKTSVSIRYDPLDKSLSLSPSLLYKSLGEERERDLEPYEERKGIHHPDLCTLSAVSVAQFMDDSTSSSYFTFVHDWTLIKLQFTLIILLALWSLGMLALLVTTFLRNPTRFMSGPSKRA